MSYTVKVREVLEKTITIDADSREEAIEKVQVMYDNEEIVLDWDDVLGSVEISTQEEVEMVTCEGCGEVKTMDDISNNMVMYMCNECESVGK